MNSFELGDGRTVYVDSLRTRSTYAGMPGGLPDACGNEQILARARAAGQVYLLPPVVDDSDPEHPRLPPYEVLVKVRCYENATRFETVRIATIVWYQDSWDAESLAEIVRDSLRAVDWEAVPAIESPWW